MKTSELIQVYLGEASLRSVKMERKSRDLINDGLAKLGLDGNGRFDKPGKALTVAASVLNKYGYEMDDVANYELNASSGTARYNIAMSNVTDPFSPVQVSDSVLVFSWHELQNDKYEALAYLS